MKQRRNIFDKEHFLEGSRQKWAGLFTLMGLLVLISSAYGWVKDPAPFLQFFLSIGVTFILGASASDVMKAWKTESSSNSETTVTTNNDNVNVSVQKKEDTTSKIDIHQDISEHIKQEGVNAPEIKPFGAAADGDEKFGRYKDF